MKRSILALALCLAAVPPLAAFQQETTDDPNCTEAPGVNCPHHGAPFFWPASKHPVPYVINSDLAGVSFATAQSAIDSAFSTWATASSSAITFAFAGQSHGGSNGQDGANTISWKDLGGSHGAFVSDTFAESIITFVSSSGEIVDVDTELNANVPFAVLPSGEDDPSDPRVDIQAVVTHEVGHFLGLAHENRFGPQVVMIFSDTSGNTTHRTLSADDRSGVRAIYPTAGGGNGGGSGGGGASGGGGGGCVIARARDDVELWPVLALMAALWLRRLARISRARARLRAASTGSRPFHASCAGPDR